MNDVVDLSEYKSEQEAIEFDSLPPEAQDKIRALAEKAGVTPDEEPAPAKTAVATAFYVYITTEGQVVAHHDFGLLANLDIQRAVSVDDIYGACANIMRDISSANSAQATITLGQQHAEQMAQQQQSAQLMQKLPKDLKSANPYPNGPGKRRR